MCTHRVKGRYRCRHTEINTYSVYVHGHVVVYMNMFILIYIYMHSYEQDLFALRAAILAFTREFSLPKPVHLFTCMVVLKELGKEQGLHPRECLFTQHNKAGSQHSLTRGLYEDVMAHNMVLVLFISHWLQE